MDISEAEKILMKWAAEKPEIGRLWIFGSRATGTATDSSDIDIAVEMIHDSDWDVTLTAMWLRFGPPWESELGRLLPWSVDLEFCDPAGSTPYVQKYLTHGGRLLYAKFTQLLHKFPAPDRCAARNSSVSGARAQFFNPHIE